MATIQTVGVASKIETPGQIDKLQVIFDNGNVCLIDVPCHGRYTIERWAVDPAPDEEAQVKDFMEMAFALGYRSKPN